MITIDFAKARNIAHDKRRAARNKAFEPLDLEATLNIPEQHRRRPLSEVEADRQVVRAVDAAAQRAIDEAGDTLELARILADLT